MNKKPSINNFTRKNSSINNFTIKNYENVLIHPNNYKLVDFMTEDDLQKIDQKINNWNNQPKSFTDFNKTITHSENKIVFYTYRKRFLGYLMLRLLDESKKHYVKHSVHRINIRKWVDAFINEKLGEVEWRQGMTKNNEINRIVRKYFLKKNKKTLEKWVESRAEQDYVTINKISINAKKEKANFDREQMENMTRLLEKNESNYRSISPYLEEVEKKENFKKYGIDPRIGREAIIISRTSPIPPSSSDEELEFDFKTLFETKGGGKKLNITDYKKILRFYKLSIPKTKKNIVKKAEKIIANKFCNCINKVQKKFIKNTPKGIAIGICTDSVINKKGYKRNTFKCKKRRSVKLYKGGRRRKKKKKTRKRKKKTRGRKGGTREQWYEFINSYMQTMENTYIQNIRSEVDLTESTEQELRRRFRNIYINVRDASIDTITLPFNENNKERIMVHFMTVAIQLLGNIHNDILARQQLFSEFYNDIRQQNPRRRRNNSKIYNSTKKRQQGGKRRKKKTRKKRGSGLWDSCKNCFGKEKNKEGIMKPGQSQQYYEEEIEKLLKNQKKEQEKDWEETQTLFPMDMDRSGIHRRSPTPMQ
jgi:hypothetical protein